MNVITNHSGFDDVFLVSSADVECDDFGGADDSLVRICNLIHSYKAGAIDKQYVPDNQADDEG